MAEEKKEVAKKPEATFSVALSNEIDRVQDALPPDFNKARFVQNCLTVLNEKPELQKYGAKACKRRISRTGFLFSGVLSCPVWKYAHVHAGI